MHTQSLKWFTDRIGKIVFRNESCKCSVCQNVYEKGLFVQDEYHAEYVYDACCCYNAEGTPLAYFDTIGERDEFELTLKK